MITIIDYGLGNLASIKNMLRKVGANSQITSDPKLIIQAEKLILPGVGSFDRAINRLHENDMISSLNMAVLEKKIPVLGICLGMQIMTSKSEEGSLPGLGWIDADTKRFFFEKDTGLKVPHMGWNIIKKAKENPIFRDFPDESRFYFVHSYYVECKDSENVLMKTSYGIEFHSAFCKENIYGVQFHPEKSHRFGMQLMKNFVECI